VRRQIGFPAEARGVDERLTQAETRRDRLVREEKALVAIEPGELEAAQRAADGAEAKHKASLAMMADWQSRVPALDEERRSLQDLVNEEARKHAELGARPAAPQAVQERCRSRTARLGCRATGLIRSRALTRIRIEPDAALERRCASGSARSIGRRKYGARSPPTHRRRRLAPSPRRQPHTRRRTAPCRASPTCSISATRPAGPLTDWLEGVYTAKRPRRCARARANLTHGEVS
jgi:chromosome segregation protein